MSCRHCGQPLADQAVGAFCCAGCRTAHDVIAACGLGDFYRFRRGEPGRPATVAAPAESGWLDGEAFAARQVHRLPDGRAVVRWRVEGIHCSACVWLLEHLPRLDGAIHAARVELADDALTLLVDPARCPPSRQVALAASLGYRLRERHGDGSGGRAERRRATLRLVVALASAIGAMHVVMNLLAGGLTGDLDAANRRGFAWLSLLVAAPALTYGAWPFWRGAVAALRLRRLTLDVTTALVLAVAIGASVLRLGSGGDLYLDAAALFVALLLAGRSAASAARSRAQRRLGGCDGLLPEHALVRTADGGTRSVAVEELAVGDVVVVASGVMAPCDGSAEGGGGRVSVAVITGEARGVGVAAGDTVWAGARNLGPELVLRATACGADTRVGALLERARAVAAVARPGDGDLHGGYSLLILVAATATGLAWLAIDPARALDQAVAMVLVLCPCALGLAVPLVQAAATARAARLGVVVRDGDALDTLARARHIVFDKTGTLTAGEPAVLAWEPVEAMAHALPWILAAEERSPHPVAGALAARLRADGVAAADLPADGWRGEPGRGLVVATSAGELRIGGPAHIGLAPWPVPAGAAAIGATLDGHAVLRAALGDAIKPGAAELVAAAGRDARVHLLSGDDPAVVAEVAAAIGVPADRAMGGADPEAKRRRVEALVAAGGPVAMVGDGLNDAAALGAAQVGIGVRGGLAACLDRCGIVVLDGSAAAMGALLTGARAVRATTRLCLAVALAYNLVAAVLVAIGWWGPLVCAVAMPASSLTVLAIALLGSGFRTPAAGLRP